MKKYYLLFVKDQQNEWGFYGFYWKKPDLDDRLGKISFVDFKIVEAEVDFQPPQEH